MQQTLTWIATGLLVGWVVRTAMKSSRDYGLFGDLVTGSLGAVLGGWIVRRLDIVTPDNIIGHVVVAVLGAAVLLGSMRLLRRTVVAAGIPVSAPTGSLVADLEEQVRRLTEIERRVLSGMIVRGAPKDPTATFEQELTFGQKVADHVASFGGSWTFIGVFLTGMVVWMAINRDSATPFDPYPYILLNLILSCVAALQAPVIMMSQNRQVARDRVDARSDYEVNMRAEVQIMALHEKLDAARDQEWARMASQLIDQTARVQRIEQQLTEVIARGK